jgi:tetratricopeptide (TPR) repeat protein
MGKARVFKWGALGLSLSLLVIVILWVGFAWRPFEETEIETPGPEEVPPVFERKNIEALDLDQLKAYITACEMAGEFHECERAFQRAIQLTHGDKSRFKEFIDLKFGLAEFYLNSLWEYGQFGEPEEVPPALTLAMDIYDEIISSYPDSELAAEAQFRKGELFHNEFSGYWNTLHRDDAIREFQKVIERYPRTDQARRAKEKLAALQKEQRFD